MGLTEAGVATTAKTNENTVPCTKKEKIKAPVAAKTEESMDSSAQDEESKRTVKTEDTNTPTVMEDESVPLPVRMEETLAPSAEREGSIELSVEKQKMVTPILKIEESIALQKEESTTPPVKVEVIDSKEKESLGKGLVDASEVV